VEFEIGHFRAIARGSNDYDVSNDDDGASQEGAPFEEVLHDILAIITNALANARFPKRLRFTGEIASASFLSY
jgi:hypothetical protein